MIVRILVWDVYDSRTTLDELRASVPTLEPPSTWVWNEATDRFGILVFGDELPEGVGYAQDLIGADADVYEEFDTQTE